MKISTEKPPNYDLILHHFPNCEKQKAVFTYGDIIFNPFFNVLITPDLEKHEEVHSKQQGDNPLMWWDRYFKDKEFRLREELLAYASQYRFVKDTLKNQNGLVNWLLEKLAEALSSELYKLDISYGEAKSKIRNMSKTLAVDK